jgi:hypothetical protein
MAKIYTQDIASNQVQVNEKGQPAVVELPDHVVLNGQVYGKTTLVPIPFEQIKYSVSSNYLMVGKVTWIKSDTTVTNLSRLGNIYFSRGTPDIVNPDVLIDNIDSNVFYIIPGPKTSYTSGNTNADTNIPFYIMTRDPLRKIDYTSFSLLAGYTCRGAFFIGQNDTHIFIAGHQDRSTFNQPAFGWYSKSTQTFTNVAPADRLVVVNAYVCQDDSNYYLFTQNNYTTTDKFQIHRVNKITNATAVVASLVPTDIANENPSYPTQSLELEAGKKSFYFPQVLTDAALAFRWVRGEVNLAAATASFTTCTVDYTIVSGGQASVVVKPGQNGYTTASTPVTFLESWAIEGSIPLSTSDNYICMLPTENDFSTSENGATFRLYIYAIDGTNKNNLILKNYIDTLVRAWGVFQVQDDWKKIAIIHSSGLKFYNWNSVTETYDMVQDLAFAIDSVMRDSNDRIWIRQGDLSVHMISATSPTRVEVIMENSYYNYQGMNISTYANVSSYDIDNNRINSNVQLVLEGSIYFIDDSQSKTIATSASGAVQVDMVIKGSSYTRILASVVV